MPTPEEQAREIIDQKLTATGWVVQDFKQLNLRAGPGVTASGPADIPHVELPLPFNYESTGIETRFVDLRDPDYRSRRVFHFHRPETLREWLTPSQPSPPRGGSAPETLRRRLREETKRFKAFSYDEIMPHDKVSLDIFWLKDESLEDTANLPDPDVLAQEIVGNLEAALLQFESIVEALGEDG
jgi:hypothetical protein